MCLNSVWVDSASFPQWKYKVGSQQLRVTTCGCPMRGHRRTVAMLVGVSGYHGTVLVCISLASDETA